MSIAVKWGLITGLVYVIFSLISNLMGLAQSGGVVPILINTVLMVITFFTIYRGIKEIRDEELNGQLTSGLALRKGMKIALIAGLLSAAFSLIYVKIIDPDFMNKVMEASEAKFDEMNAPEAQREMSRSIMKFFFNPVITVPFIILWTCFWGLLKSLVAGSMLKTEAPPIAPPTPPTV
jgi:hypothetical protein